MHTHLFLDVQVPSEDGQSISDEWVVHAAIKECFFRQCFLLCQLTGFAVYRETITVASRQALPYSGYVSRV